MATKYRLVFRGPKYDLTMYFGPSDAKAIAKKCFELGHSGVYDSIEISVVTRHNKKD